MTQLERTYHYFFERQRFITYAVSQLSPFDHINRFGDLALLVIVKQKKLAKACSR